MASGNAGNGIEVHGAGARVLNTYVGVGADGSTPAANGQVGVFVGARATDCKTGAVGEGSLTIVSGNANAGTCGVVPGGQCILNG